MFFEFFTWWYGKGWLEAWLRIRQWITKVQLEFSIPVLLHTLFSPWKQIISFPGRSLGDKFRAALDNLVSRCVGFMVRLMVLITAVLLTVVAGLLGLVIAIAWPFVPAAFIFCLYGALR